MKYLLLLMPLIAFLGTSCNDAAPLSGTIAFKDSAEWNKTVYLVQPRNFEEIAAGYMGVVVDSAAINSDGRFAFPTMPDAPTSTLFQLVIHEKGERFLNNLHNDVPLQSNYFPLVWKNGDKVQISTQVPDFQRYFQIKNPSKENAAMLELRDIRMEATRTLMKQQVEVEELLDEEKLQMSFKQPLMAFAKESEYLLPALVATRWVSIPGDYERVPEFLFGLCQKWQNAEPENPWAQQLCAKGSKNALPLMIGDAMVDFPMPLTDGDTVSLYSLLGKKLTILDLWASWCAPCRRENREYLVPLWDGYASDGLQIIGYALDATDKVWKNAIEKDGANRWTHASHLEGDNSPLFQAMRITTIPANFILDADGKIIAKNLHGDDLKAFIQQAMSDR